jgi:hypothetical protein
MLFVCWHVIHTSSSSGAWGVREGANMQVLVLVMSIPSEFLNWTTSSTSASVSGPPYYPNPFSSPGHSANDCVGIQNVLYIWSFFPSKLTNVHCSRTTSTIFLPIPDPLFIFLKKKNTHISCRWIFRPYFWATRKHLTKLHKCEHKVPKSEVSYMKYIMNE